MGMSRRTEEYPIYVYTESSRNSLWNPRIVCAWMGYWILDNFINRRWIFIILNSINSLEYLVPGGLLGS